MSADRYGLGQCLQRSPRQVHSHCSWNWKLALTYGSPNIAMAACCSGSLLATTFHFIHWMYLAPAAGLPDPERCCSHHWKIGSEVKSGETVLEKDSSLGVELCGWEQPLAWATVFRTLSIHSM